MADRHESLFRCGAFKRRIGYGVLFFFIPVLLYSAADSSGTGGFTVRIHSGEHQAIFGGKAEISYAVNMFGKTVVSFEGIIGLQMEPTSAYKQTAIENARKGDQIYLKADDSTFYLLRIANQQSKDIEIEFTKIGAVRSPTTAGEYREVPVPSAQTGAQLRHRVTLYAAALFPQGDFQDVNLSRGESGFAETGAGGGFGYTQQLSNQYEIGAIVLYSHSNLQEAFLYTQIYEAHPDAKVDSKGWDIIWFIGEGGYTGEVLPTLNYYIRGNLGILSVYGPDITATTATSSSNYLSGTSVAFAYGAAVGFRESEKIDLGLRWLTGSANLSKVTTGTSNMIMTLQFTAGYIF